jgi:hypothetical protein
MNHELKSRGILNPLNRDTLYPNYVGLITVETEYTLDG